MWRKPEAKPSSDESNAPSPMPARTQVQNTVQPKQPNFEPSPVGSTPRFTADPVSSGSSRIGAGLKIRGEISGNGDLVLDGEASGKLRINGARVTVGPTGKVQADIEAREIVINGTVQGNLKAEARLRLGASSQVEGAIAAPSVGIDDGARFRGKVEVTRSKPATATAASSDSSSDAESLNPVGVHVEAE